MTLGDVGHRVKVPKEGVFKLPFIQNKRDQCKCSQCFALFNDRELVTNSLSQLKPRLRCALDNHVVKNPYTESCPYGKPAR